MRLLVKRDINWMYGAAGKAEVDSDVPGWLKTPKVVGPDWINVVEPRGNDDLVIAHAKDAERMDTHLSTGICNHTIQVDPLPAIWSGYRSVLVSDGNGGLYRLKGVSLNPQKPEIKDFENGDWEVWGGQLRYSGQYEKQYSDKFNKVLREAGIEPVMTCKGFWHYPKRAKRYPLSASVVKVEGDTRLDEFMLLVEQYLISRLGGKRGEKIPLNSLGAKLTRNIGNLYRDIGFIVGGMKALMDKNNQTWSSTNARSNAHVGNVVLYNGTDKVKVGFVDFDASCDTLDFSLSKLRAIQKQEFATLRNSAMSGPISPRQIAASFPGLSGEQEIAIFGQYREEFVRGFDTAYATVRYDKVLELGNTIDFGRFLEIFEVLRAGTRLTADPVSMPSKPIIYQSGKIDDLYGILGRNRKYQDDIQDSKIINGYKSLEDIVNRYDSRKKNEKKDNGLDNNLLNIGIIYNFGKNYI
jgi:hypothetical protein